MRLSGLVATSFLALAFMPSSANAQSANELSAGDARAKAYDLVQHYADLCRLKNNQGENLELQFIDLFALNAVVEMDLYAKDAPGVNTENRVSPQAYCSEYYSKDINAPMPVNTQVVKMRTETELASTGEQHIVEVIVKKTFERVLSGKAIIDPPKPKVVVQQIIVRVDGKGEALISEIQRFREPFAAKWDLDAYRYGNWTGETRISNVDLNVGLWGVRLGHRFSPFKNLSPLLQDRFGILVGVGFEQWRYALQPTGRLNQVVVDYLGEDDNVVLLTDDTYINNKPGSDDFVLNYGSSFQAETIKQILFTARVALSYDLIRKKRSSTGLELGFGFVAPSNATVRTKTTDEQYAIFSEDVFSGNPVEVDPNSVSYNGDVAVSVSHADAYDFTNSVDVDYETKLSSTFYVDLKLTQFFILGDLELGVFVSVRPHLSPSLDYSSDDEQSVYQLRRSEGVPATRAFVEKATPNFLGFGISIQKKK